MLDGIVGSPPPNHTTSVWVFDPKVDNCDLVTVVYCNAVLYKEKRSMGTGQTADFDSCICRMFRTSAISFVIADAKSPDCPIIFASPSFYDSTGYSPDKGLRWATVSPSQRATTNANNTVLGRNCRFLQGPKTSRRKVSEIRDALREDRSCSVCLLNYRRDGSAFWNQFYLAPLRDDQGHVSLYIGVQCDVSAAVQAACAGQDDPDGLLESFHSSAEPTAEALEHALRSYSIDDVLFSVTGEAFPPARAGSSSSGGCAPGCTHDCSVGQMPTSLLGPLLRIQSSYVLSDPALPDCPIVHASDSFLRMTGYPRYQGGGGSTKGVFTDKERGVVS